MSPAVKPTYHQTSIEDVRDRARVDAEGHVYVTAPAQSAAAEAPEAAVSADAPAAARNEQAAQNQQAAQGEQYVDRKSVV